MSTTSRESETEVAGAEDDDSIRCSFCTKTRREVVAMVTGEQAFICDECILSCVEILTREELVPVIPELLGNSEYRARIEQSATSLSRLTTQILEALRRG